mgnify:CR=1 FL=1
MPSDTPRSTRRRVLASTVAALGLTALAGCSGSGSGSASSRAGPDAEPPEDALVSPPHVTLRGPATEPNVVRETAAENETPSPGTEIDDWAHYVLANGADADAVTFADVDGADEAKRFLEATNFDSETVYVERHLVGECYRHQLCWVRWTDEMIETDYARTLRDADVACEADTRVAVTNLIRLPVALDPDQITSHSSGSGGGACRRPEGDRREESGS